MQILPAAPWAGCALDRGHRHRGRGWHPGGSRAPPRQPLPVLVGLHSGEFIC